MSAGFTFGSLGDILQLCQISIAVGKALDDSSGSVRSYQRLRNDLDQFVQVLQNVIATYQEREHSEWLSGINFLIKSITQECMTDLEEALQYFQSKYESSLGGQGRQITPQSIGRKLGYAFKERERLQVLREKLSQNTQRLSLLLVIHNYRAARVDNNTLEKRYQEVLSKAEDISRDIQRQSIVLSEQHASVNVLITTLTTTSDHLESRATHDKNLAKEVRSIASSIQKLSVVVETSMKLLVEKRESETSHRFFRGPCSTSQPPLLFEDSFGLILGLPIEWLNSWEHLHCLISNRFEHQMGHQKVIRGEYVLEDDLSGEEITSLPWTQAMRPGLKINMAMKFHSFENESERTTEGYVCPGCGTVMQGRLDNSANLMCVTAGCGMWMKRSRARKATLSASRVPLSSDEDDHRYFHRVLFDIHVVSPPVSKNTIRGSSKSCVYVWTCCQCGDSGMTINIAHCPVCYYDRCTHCPIAKTRVRQS